MIARNRHTKSVKKRAVAANRSRRPLRAEPLESRIVLDSTVVFNEIMYHPAGGADDTLEWIELHNQMAVDMDISNWSLDGGVQFQFPEGTAISGHDYLVVAINPTTLKSTAGVNDALGPFVGNLSNSGEELRLLNNDGRQMNVVDYNDTGDWPSGADGGGVSLVKINETTNSELAENWTISPQQGGTPGVKNFEADPDPVTLTFIQPGAEANVLVPGNGNLGLSWTQPGFTPTAWTTGATGIGYEAAGSTSVAYTNLTGRGGSSAFSGPLGHDFVVNSTLTINQLGVFDSNADGLSRDLTAEIWTRNGNSGTRLASLEFTGAEPGTLVDSNRFKPLGTPLVLSTGDYTVVAHGYGSGERAGNEGVGGPASSYKTLDDGDGAISFVGSGRLGASAGAFPNAQDVGSVNYYSAGTFQFTTGSVSGKVTTDIKSAMRHVNTSAFIRVPFTASGALPIHSMTMTIEYSDGFVAYLNGHEVASRNAPITVDWNSAATAAPSGFVTEVIDLNAGIEQLITGNNVLAIHGLNQAIDDNRFLILPALEAVSLPAGAGAEIPLAIHEVAAGGQAGFFLEIANDSALSQSVSGFVVASSAGQQTSLPNQTIAGGGYLAITSDQLGFTPADGDTLFLYNNAIHTQLVDSRRVTGRLRGRSAEHDGRWLYPNADTPGAANSFTFQDGIVINEILYHDQPTISDGSSSTTLSTLIDINDTWRYRGLSPGLAGGWEDVTHTVGVDSWQAGPAPIGYESAALPVPLQTTLDNPLTNSPYVITYYFEKDFTFSENPSDPGIELTLNHLIDDGAVFYLNGQEVLRSNMPTGAINANSPAITTVDNATLSGNMTISKDALVAGQNRLSVEVHQQFSGGLSSDIVFGASLDITGSTVSAASFFESNEEWIELYNRGTLAVDMSGWSLDDAVDYNFPVGTTIGPGEYLVVARDAATLSLSHPTIDISGDFSRRLSNGHDRIELRDAYENPADVVEYYDGGRWPEFAAGGGSSLELRDPRSDNSKAEAWSASDETGQSTWNNYTIRQTASADTGPSSTWREFQLGLLDAGEVLIDAISVVRDPGGEETQLLKNGSFEADALGSSPDTWRIVGNHSGTVVVDPDNPANRVLHLVATGTTLHLDNHAETTFVGNAGVLNGTEYEIRYRAKWLTGSPQLNTRFYVNRVAATTILEVPQKNGTPGTENSVFQTNVGPTYGEFRHSPLVPAAAESVTVTTTADDPDGIQSLTLWWSAAGGAWQSTSMAQGENNQYIGTLPGKTSGTIVQFYVAGQDGSGATSTFPAAGQDSRALYKVQDGQGTTNPVDTLRIIMTAVDSSALFERTQLMSNAFRGGTLIHNNSEVFYDIGIRLKGSAAGRTSGDVNPGSYRIKFHPDHKFRGVHQSIALDGSGRSQFEDGDGQDEILVAHLINHAGGMTSLYHDLGYMIAPNYAHTRPVIMMLARYSDVYLDEAFGPHSDGTLYEFEGIYYATQTINGHLESLKDPSIGSRFHGTDFGGMGDDKEDYRWNFLIKNRRARDNYENIISMAKAFDLTGTALDQALEDVIDVDQWMRMYAMHSLVGQLDVYGHDTSPHNLWLYDHPGTGKIMVLPWDMDFAFSSRRPPNAPLHNNEGVPDWNIATIVNRPKSERLFFGHFLDLIQTTFNGTYAGAWFTDMGSLVDQNYSPHVNYIQQRANFVTSRINTLAPQVPFDITTNDPLNVATATTATLEGTGWVNVREIRLNGSPQPMDADWRVGSGASYANTWEVTIPVTVGNNHYTLEAYDYQGELIGSSSTNVTSSTPNPVADSLRITEINYNPADPTATELAVMPALDNDDFEFVEVQNIGTQTIHLLGTTFTDGLDFTFGSVTLAAGQRGVVVQNTAAFTLRYGTGANILGQFAAGQLSNAGENLTLQDAQSQTVVSFSYADSDPWPERADGSGATLVLIDPGNTPLDQLGKHYHWQGSTRFGGTPGAAAASPLGVVVNEVLARTDPPVAAVDSIELFNTTSAAIDISGWYLSDSDNHFLKYKIPDGTSLPAGAYRVFDQSDFNPTPLNPGADDFALSGTDGDDVWLTIPDGLGGVTSFVDNVHFMASPNGESWGRLPEGSGRLVPMQSVTLGSSNSAPRIGPLVISELNYNPGSPSAGALAIEPGLTANDLEFIEIQNPTATSVDLTNWRLRGGIDFDFSSGTTIGAGKLLVIISFDPLDDANTTRTAAFRAHYGIGQAVTLLGGYQQQLSDNGERVVLQRAETPAAQQPTLIPRLAEDELVYDNLSPWPAPAAGTGNSLHRTTPAGLGASASSWTAESATPGTIGDSIVGDFNGDQLVNATDIDLLQAAVISGSTDPQFDLTGGDSLTQDDVTFLVQTILGTNYGDTDLDGDIDTGDLTRAIINFTGAGGTGKTWATGDTDGDGDVDTSDITTAIIRFTGARSRASTQLVADSLTQPDSLDKRPNPLPGNVTPTAQFLDQQRSSSAQDQPVMHHDALGVLTNSGFESNDPIRQIDWIFENESGWDR